MSHDHVLQMGAIKRPDGTGGFLELALDRDSNTWGLGLNPSFSWDKHTGMSVNSELMIGPWVSTFSVGRLFALKSEEPEKGDAIEKMGFPSQQ